ncbi:hypothetical protein MaudMau93_001131 [Microsporum audouinii]
MSYTAILHAHSTHTDHRVAIQFRREKQDLSGVTEASRTHGSILPMVTYQGMKGSFVLMSSEDFKLPLKKKMVTLMDLADLVSRGARANTTISDSVMFELTSTLDGIRHIVDNYDFRNITLRSSISACIGKLPPRLHDLAALPVTLTHQDLAPFNYLIDKSTGRVQSVLD